MDGLRTHCLQMDNLSLTIKPLAETWEEAGWPEESPGWASIRQGTVTDIALHLQHLLRSRRIVYEEKRQLGCYSAGNIGAYLPYQAKQKWQAALKLCYSLEE